jgi:hypothetical protein
MPTAHAYEVYISTMQLLKEKGQTDKQWLTKRYTEN